MADAPPYSDAPVPDAPPEPTPPVLPGRRRWVPWAVGGAVVLAAVVAGVVVFGGGDDDGPDSTVPGSVTLPEPAAGGLNAGGAELVQLLAVGRSGTYHATYAIRGGDLGGESSIEVWRDGDRVRQDTVLRTDDGTEVQTAGIRVDDSTISCTKRGDEPWSCGEAETDGSETNDLFGSVEAQLEGVDVTARDDEVDGRAARCFDFVTVDGAGSACLTPEGVPLVFSAGDASIELVELDDTVPSEVFTPPAEPGG